MCSCKTAAYRQARCPTDYHELMAVVVTALGHTIRPTWATTVALMPSIEVREEAGCLKSSIMVAYAAMCRYVYPDWSLSTTEPVTISHITWSHSITRSLKAIPLKNSLVLPPQRNTGASASGYTKMRND
jgi:hypothetical protein